MKYDRELNELTECSEKYYGKGKQIMQLQIKCISRESLELRGKHNDKNSD